MFGISKIKLKWLSELIIFLWFRVGGLKVLLNIVIFFIVYFVDWEMFFFGFLI